MTKNDNKKKKIVILKKSRVKIKKGGGEIDQNIQNNIRRNIQRQTKIWGEIVPDLSNLSICELHKVDPKNFPEDIIVIKKKNDFNKPSNYIVFKYVSKEVFVYALGKVDFYNKLFQIFTSNKQLVGKTMEPNLSNNTLEQNESNLSNNIRKKKVEDAINIRRKKVEDAIISLKIIQFFGKNYDNLYRPPFNKEFYKLNNYFRTKIY
jgi:uncharacterized alkaline shock family protein YloU